jgi:hypothetical protein
MAMAGRIAELLTADPGECSGSLNGQVDPRAGTAIGVAEALAELVAAQPVAVDQRFFDDWGGDSMVMARFGVRAYKRPGLRALLIKDVPFVNAAQPACNDHSDFWFEGST